MTESCMVSKLLLHMTVTHVYRVTFKQRNCTVTTEQDKITTLLAINNCYITPQQHQVLNHNLIFSAAKHFDYLLLVRKNKVYKLHCLLQK